MLSQGFCKASERKILCLLNYCTIDNNVICLPSQYWVDVALWNAFITFIPYEKPFTAKTRYIFHRLRIRTEENLAPASSQKIVSDPGGDDQIQLSKKKPAAVSDSKEKPGTDPTQNRKPGPT